jgi:hypothetical protein
MLWARQHLDASGVLVSAPARREWNDVGLRAPRHNAPRLPAD